MHWLKGLLAAVVSGAANAITVRIVDPANTDLKKALTLALVSGLIGGALYLKQSPVPADGDDLPAVLRFLR